MPPNAIESFITRWENSGAAERANYQMFLSELCDIIEVPRPDPTSPDPAKNLHVFDRAITRVNPDGSSVTNYIDLYKARHIVCETKQGTSGTAYSALLFKEIACFNGGLFENTTALPLSAAQLAMLTDATGTDWSAVEPSIFGTLRDAVRLAKSMKKRPGLVTLPLAA